MYPPLEKDHQVFGKDYCSGYVDSDGKWNTGFYCPSLSPETGQVFCCGTGTHKYCCTGDLGGSSNGDLNTSHNNNFPEPDPFDYDLSTPSPPLVENGTGILPGTVERDISRQSYIAAMICGLVAVSVLMTLMACFYCKCCLLYRKRRSQLQLSGGICRIPASDTTCGLINSSGFRHSENSAFVSTSTMWANPVGRDGNYAPSSLFFSRTVHPSGQRGLVNVNFPSDENSSNSSLSTVSSLPGSFQPVSRANSLANASNPNINTALALRLQRQLLQQAQNQNSNSQRGIARSSTSCGNGRRGRTANNTTFTLPGIYTLPNGQVRQGGSRSRDGINSLLNFNSSGSSLPPPYFLEQYRIRNRVRVPRNPNPPTITVSILPPYPEVRGHVQGQTQSERGGQGQQRESRRRTFSPGENTLATGLLNDLSARRVLKGPVGMRSNDGNSAERRDSRDLRRTERNVNAPEGREHKDDDTCGKILNISQSKRGSGESFKEGDITISTEGRSKSLEDVDVLNQESAIEIL